jgi:cytochrome c oxidase subunit 1
LITGIFWAFIGAAMSIIFRLQLGFPEADLAWLRPILGKWIMVNDAGIGKLDPEFYYALVTMHGTILVFFVLTAGLSGTFANLLIPLQIGYGISAVERTFLLVLLPGWCCDVHLTIP